VASPEISSIVPKLVEFTTTGVFLTYEVTYKGGARADLRIRATTGGEIGKVAAPLSEILLDRGFDRD
jgi:hypothetical protein